MDVALLYIDPHPSMRLLVEKALEGEAFVVHHAPSALDAQQSAAEARPDLILVDVDRVRAAELVPALRGLPGLDHVRLLASTADARPEHVEKMLTWGFDRVWLHPLDVDALARELRLALPPAPAADAPAPAIEGPPPAEDAVPAGAAPADAAERAATALDAEPSLPPAAEAPLAPLAPAEVPPLWRLGLTPLVAQLVRSTASAEGVLALLDHDGQALAIVAAAGSRRADRDGAADAVPPVGTRLWARSVPWIRPALDAGEAVAVGADGLADSPLVPPGSQALLVVPVPSDGRVRGVVVLGKHRASRGPAFAEGKVARSLAHARQIGGVVEILEALDRAASRKRHELGALRVQSVRSLLAELTAAARPSRRNGAGPEAIHDDGGGAPDLDPVVRLGLAVAERLGLPVRVQDALREALELRDLGRAWVEQVLSARATFSVAGRERLLESAAEHGARILGELDGPPAVLELLRACRALDDGEQPAADGNGGDLPVAARVMAVVSAYGSLLAGRAMEDAAASRAVSEALAELSRRGAHRYDPEVARALVGLAAPGDAAEVEPR
jgi:CheY-like chemotaxis protein